ncbi:4Fe-4S dicluster domain-containing protein [Vibrio sp. SS-MA-C1-2]|uniref:sulfate reduction electron transfer complex DsrMKJOP subunit DsrO n=1 Tax=Vibrio sp. SS-MA-C1-2 TaxID=2908646 RepID=UPI001F28B71C|nr:4Fe-4S dicluster domain-containing protein [Vibrio sp. SS-MA-C1-2]UJF17355.1 4Fe-4S dicluster domain-containing protein [Vibrio sp. SS-MA-C1-2]
MDITKRKLLGTIGTLSAGAALIPIAGASTLSKQKVTEYNDIAKKGDSSKRYSMVIDLRRCVGCQACTVACTIENQPPLGQFRTTVNQYEVSDNDNLDAPAAFFMMPRLCNHCETPACLPVCPTGATYQRDDGIVVVNNEWCVGCGYCVQACPYEARFINHETNTADKCTFCAHRLDAGLLPACVETCVGGARVIGDLNDPNSEINRLLKENHSDIKVLQPDAGTAPRVFYIGMTKTFQDKLLAEPGVRSLMNASGEEIHNDH